MLTIKQLTSTLGIDNNNTTISDHRVKEEDEFVFLVNERKLLCISGWLLEMEFLRHK